jgi:hypothetical protein
MRASQQIALLGTKPDLFRADFNFGLEGWTVTDTESKLSVANGMLVCSGGKASPAWGDPAIVSTTLWAWQPGLTVEGQLTPGQTNLFGPMLGFFPSTTPDATPDLALYWRNDGILYARAGTSARYAGVAYSAAASYRGRVAIISPTLAGCYVSRNGGVSYDLIWLDPTVSASVWAAIQNNAAAFTADYVRFYRGAVPQPLLQVTCPAITPTLSGVELVTNGGMETGNPPTSWDISNAATLAGVADERTGGAGIQSLEATRGTGNPVASQAITTAIGTWYLASGWLKNGTATELTFKVNGPVLGDVNCAVVSVTTWTQRKIAFRAVDASGMTMQSRVVGVATNTGRFDDHSIQALVAASLYGTGYDLGRKATIIDCTPPSVPTNAQAGMFSHATADKKYGLPSYINTSDGKWYLDKYDSELIGPTKGNGGFETAGAGGADVHASWSENTNGGKGTITDETTRVNSGGHALKLTNVTDQSWDTQQFAVVPGQSYSYTIYTCGDAVGYYRFADVTGGWADIVAKVSTGKTGTAYQSVTGTFVAPAGCVLVGIQVFSPSTPGGIAYFDDVLVEAVTQPIITNLASGSVTYGATKVGRLVAVPTTGNNYSLGAYYDGALVGSITADQDLTLFGTYVYDWRTQDCGQTTLTAYGGM